MTPEVQAATERLDKIPVQLLTPEFRAAALDYAKALTQRRLRTEAIERAAADVQASISAGNFDVAGEANARRLGLEQLQLPPAGLPEDVTREPLRLALQHVMQAANDMLTVTSVRYVEELEAWRDSDQRDLPPVMTPADQQAVDLVKGMHMLRKPILDAIATWRQLQGRNPDPVVQLEQAVRIGELVAEYAPKHEALRRKVEEANQARQEAIAR